jgi:hypothetical protein
MSKVIVVDKDDWIFLNSCRESIKDMKATGKAKYNLAIKTFTNTYIEGIKEIVAKRFD